MKRDHRTLFWILASLIVALTLMAGPPVPPGSKPVLRSPKDAASQPVKAQIVPQVVMLPPPILTLAWDYTNAPPDYTNYIVFEAWSAPTPQGPWTLFDRTKDLFTPVGVTNPAAFFRVRDFNTTTQTPGPWNR